MHPNETLAKAAATKDATMMQALAHTALHGLRRRIGARASGLRRNEDGIAAMEFVIIAPLIIFMYLALAELSLMMSTQRQVAHSASVTGDMVAQVTEVDEAAMADIMAAALRVAQVRDSGQYVIEVTSYTKDTSGNITTVGSAIYNAGGKEDLATVDPSAFGDELLSADSGVVVANVAYAHAMMGQPQTIGPDKGKALFGGGTRYLRETFMLKPRRSDSVAIGEAGDRFNCGGTAEAIVCTKQETTETPGDDDDDDD